MSEASNEPGIAPSGFEWLLIAGLVVVFTPAILALSDVWSRYDYYSHGYMVPFAALWAATAQRSVWPTLRIEGQRLGVFPLAACLLLYLFASLAGIVSLQGLTLVLAVASTLYFARGAAWLGSLGFPIFYLIFMVPMPDRWLAPFIASLQIFVSATVIEILHLFSLPVYREGNVMVLPDGATLFVAEACSGITSIVTLVPLAVFLAYFTERTLVRRLCLVVAVIPLAMLGNLMRVILTIVAAMRFGVEFATGDLIHTWAGIGTYVLGCLALLAVGSLMKKYFPEKKSLSTQ